MNLVIERQELNTIIYNLEPHPEYKKNIISII